MGKEDYASTGGALKLKGAKDAGVTKKKKKKSRAARTTSDKPATAGAAAEGKDADADADVDVDVAEPEPEPSRLPLAGKTEAELRFEKRKWMMMDEKLKKEGFKTHKERVEEYNKYLANLSEHHDMPRIGPG